jgi:hypothetical protein
MIYISINVLVLELELVWLKVILIQMNQTKIYNISWNSKNKEARKG